MKSMEELDNLKPFQARSIIEELRKGSVPADYVPFFTVGRDNWLTFIEDDLQNYIAEGGAKVRFLSGDYGDGKPISCRLSGIWPCKANSPSPLWC